MTGDRQDEYRLLFNNMPQGFALHEIICDAAGKPIDYRFLAINPAFERLTGLKAAELLGRTVLEVMPGTETYWIEKYGKVALTGETICFESFSREINRYYEVTAYRPAPNQFAVIFLDVTERKQASEALHVAVTKYKTLFETLPLGLTVTDKNGKIIETNATANRLLGLSLEEHTSRRMSDAEWRVTRPDGTPMGPEEYPGIIALKERRIVSDITMGIERPEAETVWLSVSAAPIDLPEYGVIIVYGDITEKQKLREYSQRADKLSSLGVLAGGIAHDFNNLLGGLFGYLDLARSSATISEARECLDEGMKSFSRARDLTHQLLTFAKGGTPTKATKSLKPLLVEWTRFALSGSKISPEFAIEEDLWPADFDQNQIGQVVDNIIINAVQAMPQGGVIKVVALNTQIPHGVFPTLKPGRYVHLSIKDSGTGIPAGVLPHIFDPFFTTKQKGSGLGLATAYSIVKKHNGEITVETKVGEGTTFHILLPASEHSPQRTEQSVSGGHHGTGRILIMDDEVGIREVLGRMLGKMGYDVAYCVDGTEALRLIEEARRNGVPFAVAFMDLTIPGGLGGKETAAEIRTSDQEIRIIVASGYSSDPVLADPKAFGFDDKVQKPFRFTEIQELMARLFNSDLVS